MTRIVLDVPGDIAAHLATAWGDLSRGVLMAISAAGYRDGTLSREQVGQALGLSFWDTEAFLKQRHAYLVYDEKELEEDHGNLDRFRGE